jgi:hypothetical protein
VATVTVVAVNVKLRKQYFFTILTLAVADLLGILFKLVTLFLEFEFMKYMQCVKPSFYIITSSCITIELNAILQVVLLAVIKFLLLVYPLESRMRAINKLIAALSYLILCFSALSAFWVRISL